jgi:hypothetical protein
MGSAIEMKNLDRLIISSIDKDGKYHTVLNPPLMYLDSSAWIDILNAYSVGGENIVEGIGKAIGDTTFRILFSLINFHELIGKHGDISHNFSRERLEAIRAPILSALIPPMIIDQEVSRFLDRTTDGVRILDPSHVAVRSMHKASQDREAGSIAWLSEQRQSWDEMLERDRVLELEADVWEHSRITPSPSQVITMRNDILSGSLHIAREKRARLAKMKQAYKEKHIRLLSQKCLVLSARIHGSRGPRPRNGCFGFSADFQQAVGRAGGPRWRQPRAPGGCPLSAWPCC